MEEIIRTLISAIEQNPGVSVEENLRTVINKMGLNAQNMAEINDAFSMLDAIQEKSLDLGKKRNEGNTRIGWIRGQLENVASDDKEKEEIVIPQIKNGVQSAFDNTLSQEF